MLEMNDQWIELHSPYAPDGCSRCPLDRRRARLNAGFLRSHSLQTTGFFRIVLRQNDTSDAVLFGRRDHGQYAGNRPDRTIQASSPISSVFIMRSCRSCPLVERIPAAIAKSNADPSLRISAGAKLTVIRCSGKVNPQFLMAARTRSIDSLIALSGSPR